jgi:hypothetical protein
MLLDYLQTKNLKTAVAINLKIRVVNAANFVLPLSALVAIAIFTGGILNRELATIAKSYYCRSALLISGEERS